MTERLGEQSLGNSQSVRENLPAQLTTFIGREREITALCAMLRQPEVRLVTLTGVGGVGKTRLGLKIAAELLDEFPDGVFFVSLASISDAGLVIPTIAETLGIREVGDRILLDLLKAYLHDRSMLLLLDNFEQVIAVSVQVADLLAACSKLKLVVTSRAVLHVQGEQEFPVPSLTIPDPNYQSDLEALSQYESVALFLQRAHAALPDFRLNESNAATVAEICMQLEGLPLAIELAAARIKLLPPQALLVRLEHPLHVLTSGSRDLPARHQTLRDTIAWSYHLLDMQEQRLFRRLSVFVGGCTLEAVEAVCYATRQEMSSALDEVASLIDKSLLLQVAREGEARLMMLKTIREFGLEILQESGEAERVQNAHARYFLNLTEELQSHYFDIQAPAALDLLEREFENLRAALTWLAEAGETEQALRLAIALWWFWYARGHLSEGRRWIEELLRNSEKVSDSLRAKALNHIGWFAYKQDDSVHAKQWLNEALCISRQLGDKKETGVSLHRLSLVAWLEEDYQAVQTYSGEALIIFNDLGDKEGIADTLLQLSETYFQSSDYDDSYKLVEQAMTLFRESGDQWGIALCLIAMADVLFMQGDAVTARKLAGESLGISIELGYMGGIAHGLEHMAEISAAMDEPVRAAQLWGTEEALRDGEIASGSFLPNMPSIEHESYVRSMAEVRARLGDEAFAIAWAEGRAMTPAQALAAMGTVATPKTSPSEQRTRHSTKSRISLPDELTEREGEVLRLVARGLTNEQVAEQLIISPRTVNSHLTSIYAKIGVTSRSGATRYAIEKKLV